MQCNRPLHCGRHDKQRSAIEPMRTGKQTEGQVSIEVAARLRKATFTAVDVPTVSFFDSEA